MHFTIVLFPLLAIGQQSNSLVYTVVGDSLVAFGWNLSNNQFEQYWCSAPLRLSETNDINWLITDRLRAEERVPAILGIDRYGIIRVQSHNKYPEFLPFSEVDLSGVGRWKHIWPIDLNDQSFYLVHRMKLRSQSNRMLELYPIDTLPLNTDIRFDGAPSPSWSFSVADIDGDNRQEVLIGGNHIYTYELRDDCSLIQRSVLPISGLVDVIRVGDVDGDDIPEIIASGSNGRITVYGWRRSRPGTEDKYPVIWQSNNLGGFTQGLAIDEISEKPGNEIICATFLFPHNEGIPQMNIFEIDDIVHPERIGPGTARSFSSRLSIQSPSSGYPGITTGDLTGDGNKEIVINGAVVYQVENSNDTWRFTRTDTLLPSRAKYIEGDIANTIAIVHPSLKLNNSIQVSIPERWIFTGLEVSDPSIQSPDSINIIELCPVIENVWGESRPCTLKLSSTNPDVEIIKNQIEISAIPAGHIAKINEGFEVRSQLIEERKSYSFIVDRYLNGTRYQRFYLSLRF
ncbi:FG-GAP repeat domain-containing protein [Gemmatimonadota bacterium]